MRAMPRSFRQSRLRTWRDTINLMQCHSITNAPVIIPPMKAWKREGLIRHVGVTHHESAAQDQLTTTAKFSAKSRATSGFSAWSRRALARIRPGSRR